MKSPSGYYNINFTDEKNEIQRWQLPQGHLLAGQGQVKSRVFEPQAAPVTKVTPFPNFTLL